MSDDGLTVEELQRAAERIIRNHKPMTSVVVTEEIAADPRAKAFLAGEIENWDDDLPSNRAADDDHR